LPAVGNKSEAIAQWRAFGREGVLLAIRPALTQIILVRMPERLRLNPQKVVTWTMCKVSAHVYSLNSRTNNTKDLSITYIRYGKVFCSHISA
jgi:hypothetical protein